MKHERLSIRLGNAAAQLPAHERMEFGVLVDFAVYVNDKALFLEGLQVGLERGESFHGCPVNDQGERR
jgi:hypothetical protein